MTAADSTTANPILSDLERTIRRQVLKFHVGQTIFCPECQSIMDVRRAVEVDYETPDGTVVHSSIRCVDCFDRNPPAEGIGVTRKVNDGRVLFPPPAPRVRSTAPRVAKKEPVPGATYLVKHSSGEVPFRYIRKVDRSYGRGQRALWHFAGVNLKTGREIELKSRARFIREIPVTEALTMSGRVAGPR